MPLLTGGDFFDLFRTFHHTAYRLEVRESYYEKEQLSQFLAGEQVDLSYMEPWLALMVQLRVAGKRVERIRVVSRPYSDYTRYGLWLCQYNIRAGEVIRYLDREDAARLPDHDYWLLDSSRLYIVRFTETDELLGAEPVDDAATVVQHGYWRDAARHHTTTHRAQLQVAGGGVAQPTNA